MNLQDRFRILLKMSEETISEIHATQQHTSVKKNQREKRNEILSETADTEGRQSARSVEGRLRPQN